MRENLRGTLWRLGIYVGACLLAIAVLFAVYSQVRFEKSKTYNAIFSNVSQLRGGNFVRIAGVETGKIKSISIQPDSTVRVKFSVDDTVILTEGTRAVIRYDDLIGGRYLALEEGAGDVKKLNPGATIPLSRTQPALDLDTLIGGFRPLFRALNPDQVNALSGQLIAALQGQGAAIGSILTQTAALTNSLADRDRLIGEVITNLNTLLGSLGEQSGELAKTIDSLSELVAGLQARKQDITNGLAYANAAAGAITDLMVQARPPLKKVVHETDRTAGIVMADHDYVDNLINTLPDMYQLLGRQGLHGDFFSFYMCDIVLKLNGKGGQPVYVKLAGQDTGRCAPK
ncbi:MCE family protein [uncultured Mycobacterium sp.]|uniref:MCE family protein n=1 Tax=uncultured Mycobacterium sp. TaxID=171292 RepID=UPI0035C999E2